MQLLELSAMRKYRLYLVIMMICCTLSVAAYSWCQQNGAGTPDADVSTAPSDGQAAAAVGTEEKDERVELRNADSMFRDKAANTYFLKGNVLFEHADVLLYADEAEYYDEDHPQRPDSAKALGNLKIVDPEATITGDLLEVDFGKKIAIVTGNVRIIAHKQKKEATADKADSGNSGASESISEKKTVITCDRVEYQYDEKVKLSTATGNLKAVQEDKTLWATKAVHSGLTDEVELTGNVRVKTDDGDDFRTETATVHVEDEWIRTGKVTGITFRRSEDKVKSTDAEAQPKSGNGQSTLQKDEGESEDGGNSSASDSGGNGAGN